MWELLKTIEILNGLLLLVLDLWTGWLAALSSRTSADGGRPDLAKLAETIINQKEYDYLRLAPISTMSYTETCNHGEIGGRRNELIYSKKPCFILQSKIATRKDSDSALYIDTFSS